MTVKFTDYLRDLATRLRKVPVCHGVDGYDIDTLREVSMGIAELEKANVAYVDANTNLIAGIASANAELARLKAAINWCIERDDRNGSLPEAYREKLIAATA